MFYEKKKKPDYPVSSLFHCNVTIIITILLGAFEESQLEPCSDFRLKKKNNNIYEK